MQSVTSSAGIKDCNCNQLLDYWVLRNSQSQKNPKIVRVFKSQSAKPQNLLQKPKKIPRKSQKKSRSDCFGHRIKFAAHPRFQNRSVFGMLRFRACNPRACYSKMRLVNADYYRRDISVPVQGLTFWNAFWGIAFRLLWCHKLFLWIFKGVSRYCEGSRTTASAANIAWCVRTAVTCIISLPALW